MNEVGGARLTGNLELDGEFRGLREEYVSTMKAGLATSAHALRPIINRLVEVFGVNRAILLAWGIEAGFKRQYVSTVLSQVLCAKGNRMRQPGGGREFPQEALILRAFAREKFGERAGRFLLSAYRYDKSQEAEQVPVPSLRVL